MPWLRQKLDELWVGAVVPSVAYVLMGMATILVLLVGVRLLGLDPADLRSLLPE